MTKYLNAYRNWRVVLLSLLALADGFLLLCETDEDCELGYLIIVKVVAFALAYFIYRLGKYWNGKGKINELMALADED